MLLILLSWFYIFVISLAFGVSTKRIFKLKKLDNIIALFLGFFSITLFTGFWAIFFAVNSSFHFVLLGLTILLYIYNKHLIKQELTDLKQNFQDLTPFLKGILISLLLFILAQCASPPFIIDNESYYIQTIKWLNEYGFVKGLVNLHLFLGQTSGWHILQSAFNFSFIYENFNDLSGFCLLLGNVYAITKLNDYLINSKALSLSIGLFPIFNVFLFQFISAPSPDVAVYVIGLIIFHQFIICYSNYKKSIFITIALLSLFIVFIKLTAVILLLLTLILVLKHKAKAKKEAPTLILFGLFTFSLFMVKNIIITGNVIYPLNGIDFLTTNWSLPKSIERYFSNYSKSYGYGLSFEAYENASFFSRLKSWLFISPIDTFFNIGMLILFFVSPLFIKTFKNKKALFIIYIIAILNIILLFATSPQYRFFFLFFMVLSLVIISSFFKQKKNIYALISVSTFMSVIPLFYVFKNSSLTNTSYHNVSSAFSTKYLIEPHNNSKYSEAFNPLIIENMTINTPTEIGFFWATGNIPLPALNEQQYDYFKAYFNVVPQQRGETLKDGFYSKIIDNDE